MGRWPTAHKFCEGFLKYRSFEINTEINNHQPHLCSQGAAGAILCHVLFDLVMRDITGELATITLFKNIAYADDITIWTDGITDVKTATAPVQRVLGAVQRGLTATGLRTYSGKTQYIVLGGLKQTRKTIDIWLGGRRLAREASRWMRILAVPLHEQGAANE